MKLFKLEQISLGGTKIKAQSVIARPLEENWKCQLRAVNSTLKRWLREKAKIAEHIQARDQQAQKDFEERIVRREAQQMAGQKPRGREPKAPETGPKAKDQINLTDEQSHNIPSEDGFIQGYHG